MKLMHKGKRKLTARQRNYIKRRIVQAVIGLFFLAMTALLLAMCAKGNSPQEKDATFALVTVPLGLYCIFTREIFISI